MKKLISIFFLLSVFTNMPAQERTSALLPKVLKQLKIDKSKIHEALYSEKVLPYEKTSSVVVIPKYRVKETDEYGNLFLQLDAYIIIADNATGKILYKSVEENAWTSDADMINDIQIDTGLYRLDQNTRAFGIRVGYEGSSRPNPSNSSDLSLYITQNNRLKKVLNNYKIDQLYGEWDTRCAGEFHNVRGSVSIGGDQSNGLSNLIIKQQIEDTINEPKGDDCNEKKTVSRAEKVLRYNGTEYR